MNITRNCGIEKTIHEKCHHDIIYGTLNFNVPLPPPYYREIWDYKHANTENIQKAISMFDWQKAFENKNTNEMTRILTDTLMNIFKNFIPHKLKKLTVNIQKGGGAHLLFLLRKKEQITLKDSIKSPQITIKVY